jgi:hypothetical protein
VDWLSGGPRAQELDEVMWMRITKLLEAVGYGKKHVVHKYLNFLSI